MSLTLRSITLPDLSPLLPLDHLRALSETHADPDNPDPAYEAHIDRPHAEVLYLPCSRECANWLRYGIQQGRRPGAHPWNVLLEGP